MTSSRVRFAEDQLVPPVPQQTQEHQQHVQTQKDQEQTQQYVQSSFAHTSYTQMLNPIVGYGNSASQLHHHRVGSQSMYQHVPEHELLDCAFSDAHKSMMMDEDPIGLPTLTASHGAVGDAVHNVFRENSDGAGPRDEGDDALFKPDDDDATTTMKANAGVVNRGGALTQGGGGGGGAGGGPLISRRHTSSSCTSAELQQPAQDTHILTERSGEGGSGSGCGSDGRESNDAASNDSSRMEKLKRTISAPACGLIAQPTTADGSPTVSGLAAKARPKKQRPMSTILANRRSAARSRARRVQYVANLEATVQMLKDHVNQLTEDLKNERMSSEMVRHEANSLRSQVDAVAYGSSAQMQLMYQTSSPPQPMTTHAPAAAPSISPLSAATPAHQ